MSRGYPAKQRSALHQRRTRVAVTLKAPHRDSAMDLIIASHFPTRLMSRTYLSCLSVTSACLAEPRLKLRLSTPQQFEGASDEERRVSAQIVEIGSRLVRPRAIHRGDASQILCGFISRSARLYYRHGRLCHGKLPAGRKHLTPPTWKGSFGMSTSSQHRESFSVLGMQVDTTASSKSRTFAQEA